MACGCKKNATNQKFEWTDGQTTVIYNSEIQAKAKVLRKGGTYRPVGG